MYGSGRDLAANLESQFYFFGSLKKPQKSIRKRQSNSHRRRAAAAVARSQSSISVVDVVVDVVVVVVVVVVAVAAAAVSLEPGRVCFILSGLAPM